MTVNGRLRHVNSGGSGILDAARCPACGHPTRIHNVVGCVSGPCECLVTRTELMPDAPRLEVPDGIESTPAAKATAPAAAPVAPVRPPPTWDPPKLPAKWSQPAATHPIRKAWTAEEAIDAPVAPPAAPAAPPAPVRTPAPAAPPAVRAAALPASAGPADEDVVVPVVELPPWLPGAGLARMKREHPDLVPVITEVDERRADEIIAAGKAAPYKRPRLHARPAALPALGSAAVVGEHDAVEEVTAGSGATGPAVTDPPPVASRSAAGGGSVRWEPVPAGVQVTPEPLDLVPFLGASLHCYSAWYCARCYQRRLDPGACPECGRALVPVHVVICPRETQ